MTTPFITQTDEYQAQSTDPLQIGQYKLNQLSFHIGMTDAEMDATLAQAKQLRDTYQAWATFKTQLDLRKKRLLGFQAVVLAMDVTQAAAAMNTTPALVTGTMQTYAQAEATRIAQLQAMWDAGQLPDGAVLSDPSVTVVANSDVNAPPPATPGA